MATKSPNIRLYSTNRKIYFTCARELAKYYGVSNNCANTWVSNKVIPNRTPQQYYIDNHEQILKIHRDYDQQPIIKLRRKQYDLDHKAHIKMRCKQYYLKKKLTI